MGLKMLDVCLSQQIERAGQQHLLQFWDELTAAEQVKFADQLARLDWELIGALKGDIANSQKGRDQEARHAMPPEHVVRTPKTAVDLQAWQLARQMGEEILRAGQVGVIVLAGGQGTRLGFQHSKGMFPIGPVTGKSLFELLATQLVATGERYGHSIPYFVMTSDSTHRETEAFFKEHSYFGVSPHDVFFFQQGYAPSIDLHTGEVLLADKGSLSMNPDGHGGLFAALWRAGLFDEMKRRGVEYLFSHQIDNPLTKVCDPTFIGLHVRHKSEVSTKVVAKSVPEEKVGVAVSFAGRTRIIEYSDLPSDLALERDTSGELRFWAGNTAIHLFNRSFLESVATSERILPWHHAIKKIPYVNKQGDHVSPERENGVKFERFMFDTLPLAKVALIVETIRDEEFAPLKNKDGEFSAEYVRQRMVQVAVNWLKTIGVTVPDGISVEISPRFAMSAEDLANRSSEVANLKFDGPLYLSPTELAAPSAQIQQRNLSELLSSSTIRDPLVFDTFYRPQVWGGRGLSEQLHRSLPSDGPYGEAWELSPLSLHVSRVSEGPHSGRELNDLWSHCRSELTGRDVQGGFPLLIKWLECRELLSLQVHPNDEFARSLLNDPHGKSEAWVVISAEPTARIFAGLKPGVTREIFLSHLNAGTLQECVHSFAPRPGDCVSIPAGTIHSAGGGLLVAEVQQSSDATFRLFDWNRLGLDGKPRPLQVERAMEVIDWTQGPIVPIVPSKIQWDCDEVHAERLVDENCFRMERYSIQKSWPTPHAGELTIWMLLDGDAELHNPTTGYRRQFCKGSTTVIPANAIGTVWTPRGKDPKLTLLGIRLP